jgi:hypothetical protein
MGTPWRVHIGPDTERCPICNYQWLLPALPGSECRYSRLVAVGHDPHTTWVCPSCEHEWEYAKGPAS